MADDQMQIDPAIAEAMGFTGFGMQTNKNRKHNSEDAFIDTSTAATGANATEPLHHRGKQPDSSTGDAAPKAAETDAGGKPTLEALRHGVRNAEGDMVYFLPSFIEDPWKNLKPQ